MYVGNVKNGLTTMMLQGLGRNEGRRSCQSMDVIVAHADQRNALLFPIESTAAAGSQSKCPFLYEIP